MSLPKLSIIIPSFNQGDFIEETILSVINQDYPFKELIIIDGGSSDKSLDIIKKYAHEIKYWISEKDKGQSHAINKGYAVATGDYIAWMNSDDLYFSNALIKIFSKPDIDQYDFIYGPVAVGTKPATALYENSSNNKKFNLFNLLHFFYSVDYIIPSQSVFVKRSFLEANKIKFLNEDYDFCMDLEWYCRIALSGASYYKYKETLSFFRINNTTKTGSPRNGIQQEAIQIFLNNREYLKEQEEKTIFKRLYFHRILNKIYKGLIKRDFKTLLIIGKRNVLAFKDRRFMGLIKRSLLERK